MGLSKNVRYPINLMKSLEPPGKMNDASTTA